MRQAFVCDPGYGRRISGYTDILRLFVYTVVEVRNTPDFEVVLLWGMHLYLAL
jgi:hypothetical protein